MWLRELFKKFLKCMSTVTETKKKHAETLISYMNILHFRGERLHYFYVYLKINE